MPAIVDEQVHLVTAEEYFRLPADGRVTELIRGQVAEMNPPGFKHGKRCARIAYLLSRFLEEHDIGHLVGNDAGIITERDPDTVRGADVAFYSYRRVPKDAEPEGYPDAIPELVFEVLSPGNRWPEIHEKIGEYLQAGVSVVCVVDPQERKIYRYLPDHGPAELNEDEIFDLPQVLPGLKIAVGRFFE